MNEPITVHEYARLFATLTNKNVFLTGKAGTGKTTFLRKLKENSPKQMAVVAPTGVAAINAGGTTIHSFFQLPLTPFIPTEFGRKELISKQHIQSNRRKVLRELELLVIDEISMVRADVLDAIDAVLRHIRYRHNEPFGGVQMIFIGDMFQLSPVAQAEEMQILSNFYQGLYFFNSHVIQEKPFVHIEFDKIFRQKDIDFIRLLNEVRNNKLSAEGRAALNSRYNPTFMPPEEDTYITLTTHNYKADKINREELDKLNSKSKFFKATVKNLFPERNYPVEENLELKIGAKVMFVKNDSENPRRFYNGKIGVVSSWNIDGIFVKSPEDDSEILVSPMSWENIQYKADETTLQVNEEVLGTFTQYPLRLAWAITIHKSQGLTFDKAIIDAGAAFAPGQVYVALSRCRSLQGLVLFSHIDSNAIRNDNEILQFSSHQQSVEQLGTIYDHSQRDYHVSLLIDIFNFHPMLLIVRRWLKDTDEVASSFSEGTIPLLNDVIRAVDALDDVGKRFATQIVQILSRTPSSEDELVQRLDAASVYFLGKIDELFHWLQGVRVSTDSKEYARDFDRSWNDFFALLERKRHWIKGIKEGFSVEKYFELRKSFNLPESTFTSYSRGQKRRNQGIEHVELLEMLYEVRDHIVDEYSLPIYRVANSKSIQEMAEFLPTSKSDLVKIQGFGEAKAHQFGKLFLDIIIEYCKVNGLKSRIDKLTEMRTTDKKSKSPKENKPKKTDTKRISFEQFMSGKTIEQIAQERNLTYGTISGHLAHFVEIGELDIHQFISDEKLNEAAKHAENIATGSSLYSTLRVHFDDREIQFLLSWFRMKTKNASMD